MSDAIGYSDPVSQLHDVAFEPFAQAKAMPKSVYTSSDFLDAEMVNIFAKEWFCVGRSDGLPNVGDYATFDLAGQPIMVVRENSGQIRAHANVCRHRMSTLLTGCGNTRAIVCPYHGWTYNLDGTLRGAPAMNRNVKFDRRNYSLPAIRCEEWLGWVLVSLDLGARPVRDKLARIEEMISDYDMAGYRQIFFETYQWDTNWKVLAENFMESYHLPVCHAATIGGLSKVDEIECPEGFAEFNYHTLQKDASFTLSVAHPDNRRLVGDRRYMTYLFAIYPGWMITLTPGYFWYLSLYPLAPGKVRIFFGGGMSKDFVNAPDSQRHFAELRALLDKVNEEDRECTERVFAGMKSDFPDPGHLSHLERPNYEFAQYLAEKIPRSNSWANSDRHCRSSPRNSQ